MSNVKAVENAVQDFSREELTAFREWFINYDGEARDRQIEADIKAGKLDELADKAITAGSAGCGGSEIHAGIRSRNRMVSA